MHLVQKLSTKQTYSHTEESNTLTEDWIEIEFLFFIKLYFDIISGTKNNTFVLLYEKYLSKNRLF